ncbi:MAG: flagellar basal body L-ring protein FlgH [Alphaproteobacteria bacterium]
MSYRRFSRLAVPVAAAMLMAGCNAVSRLSEVGSAPQMTTIQNPVAERGYQPVALPMPRPQPEVRQANSLWRPGARAFFKDQRAAQIGDILTVNIAIDDEAQIDNETERTRTSDEDANASSILGYEGSLARILPEAVDPTNLVSLGSESTSRGRGTSNRKEQISLTVAAIVTQNLPNGNLVITGRQEVRVNYELRILTISGVVRPEDITADNTVKHTQIAEARISYGGKGQLSDLQQPRYGQQIFDIVFPF